jgi:DNA-binding beta-propeller fold protein YncE
VLLRKPQGVAVDDTGSIHIADTLNHRIVKLDSSGRQVAALGTQGSGPDEMLEPRDLAIDANGRIWVAELGNNRVHVFDDLGTSLAIFAGDDAGVGRLAAPSGIAVRNGTVYVADTLHHRVLKIVTV